MVHVARQFERCCLPPLSFSGACRSSRLVFYVMFRGAMGIMIMHVSEPLGSRPHCCLEAVMRGISFGVLVLTFLLDVMDNHPDIQFGWLFAVGLEGCIWRTLQNDIAVEASFLVKVRIQ